MTPGLSDDHKAALAEGRRQSHAVRHYLEALAASGQGDGRNPVVIRREIGEVREAAERAGPAMRIQLVQLRLNLEDELRQRLEEADPTTFEPDFLECARAYAERKGISYAAWREVGVPADVLERAGIREERKKTSNLAAFWDDDDDDEPPSLADLTPGEAVIALLGEDGGSGWNAPTED